MTARIDPHSETWRALEKAINARIGELAALLLVIGTPPERTEGLRHAIHELEGILKLPSPSKIPHLPPSSDPSL